MTATLAASLLLAGGAGVLASLLVAPVRGARRLAVLAAVSAAAIGVGLALLGGAESLAAALPG